MEDTPRPSAPTLYHRLEEVDSIRLCVLHPGQSEDPIVCTLSTSRLSAKPVYEAISYTWGSLTAIGHVLCNDAEFPVTKNLLEALRHFRSPDEARKIWIDQICINQKDRDERSQQVRIMRDIYHEAGRTVIWLGEASDGSDDAMDLIPKIVNANSSHSGDSFLGVSDWPNVGLPPITDPVWIAFGRLMRRPWFHRTWTLQEAAVSREVVVLCGAKMHPWSLWEALNGDSSKNYTLLTVPENLTSGPTLTDEPQRMTAKGQVSAILGLRQILLNPRPGIVAEPMVLFSHGRQLRAKDPRDKVFALLRLTSPNFQAQLSKPDYRRSVRDIYLETATKIIATSYSLKILYAAGCSTQQHDLPSWVPDWSVPCYYPNLGFYLCFSATGRDLQGFADTGDDPTWLQVKAKILSSLSYVGNSFRPSQPDVPYDNITQYFLPRVRHQYAEIQTCYQLASQRSAYPTGEDPRAVFQQTIIAGVRMTTDADQTLTRISASEALQGFERYEEYAEIAAHLDEFPEDEVPMGKGVESVSEFFSAFDIATSRRVFGMTEDGYMGLVPSGSRLGDRVGVILGCDVPFILRPAGNEWKLIGECYIHGLMDGEALCLDSAPIDHIWLT